MKKKLVALLALIMSVTMIATACGDNIEPSADPDVTLAEETTVTTVTTTVTTEAETEATTVATTTAPVTTKAPVTTAAPKVTTAATTAAPVTTPATTVAVTTAPSPAGLGKYAYSAMKADEKACYDEIIASVKALKTDVTFKKAYGTKTIQKAFKSVFYHEPSLFWISGVMGSSTDSTLKINYNYSQSQVTSMQKEIDAAAKAIMSKYPAGASANQKVQIIHDSIATKTLFSKDGEHSGNIYGALVDGTAQCQGYAQSVAYLCTLSGIENTVVAGQAPTGTHAWVKVQLNSKWYNVDLTFDVPKNRANTSSYLHRYLLIPDSQLTHKVDDTYTPPAANSLDLNYFVTNGLYATKNDQIYNIMKQEVQKAAKAGTTYAEFKCANAEIYSEARKQLASNKDKLLSEANASATKKATKLGDYSDQNTLTIQINITY